MKYKLYLISMLLFFVCTTGIGKNETDNGTNKSTKVSEVNLLNIQCSPELYNLITTWSNEYNLINVSTKIKVEKTSFPQLPDNIGFINGQQSDDIIKNSEWKIIVGHDAIVPIMNAKNPFLKEISKQGISAKKFAELLNGNKELNWANLINGAQNISLNFYMCDNATVIAAITKFTKTKTNLTDEIKVTTPEELIAEIQNDLYAIGFVKLKDIRKINSNEWLENIMLLPIDKNENGRIDKFENIYDNPDAFARGVWIGKYPSVLCGNIYALSAKKPTDENTLQFLTWIISNGGKFLNENGYSELASSEIQSNINLLKSTDSALVSNNTNQASNRWIIILSLLVILGFVSIYIFRKLAIASKTASDNIHITPVLNENTIDAPNGLYFDKTHTWSFIEKDGLVKIGIDDFLQHITGTITRVVMKEPGDIVRKGEKILTIIRFGKQLNIYSPISGIIKEQNQQLHSNSQLLNSSPYSDGWVYRVEPKNWIREIQFMFMSHNYKEWLKDEFTRLKDFFALTVKSNNAAYAQIILQDGGELNDKILAEMEPEVWEDFQTKFIDISK